MAAAAADPAPPETALPGEDRPEDIRDDQEVELCRICFFPGEAGRPLRHPCACQGTIGHVHDDCQLRWIATSRKRRCQVCKHDIAFLPVYAEDAPARLPLSQFMAGLPGKLMGLLLPLFFTGCVVREIAVHLATFSAWHILLGGTFARARGLLAPSISTTPIVAQIVLLVVFAHRFVPFSVAPFTRWVERLETRRQEQGCRGIDQLQVLAILVVEACWVVLIADVVVACIFGLFPFSLGRIILWSMLCFNFGNVDEDNSNTSTTSTIMVGYLFIFSAGVSFVGVNIFRPYLNGERLMIAIFYRRLCATFFSGVSIFFRRLPGIFFGGILNLINVANISVNILYTFLLHPLFIGWLLDICTSKMFGATMSQRFKLPIASSFYGITIHWFIGHTILSLRPRFFNFFQKILKPGIMIRFVKHNVYEAAYRFYFKKLPSLFVDITFIALIILVPVQIVARLAPEVFPLDITYFDCPAKGTSFWQGPRYYAESLSGVLFLKFLIDNTVLYLEWLVWRVGYYWVFTAGEALWNVVLPKEQYDSTDEVTMKRRFVAVQTMPQVVLSWLSVLIFNSAMLFFSIAIGRTLLSAIPELLVADQMKSNDLFAIAVGLGVISFIIAATRDAFVCMIYGGTRLVTLEIHVIFFIWIFFIPLLIGLLVDLSLLTPFIGPGNVPVLDFFCTWSLGRLVQNYGTQLVLEFELGGDLSFFAYSIDNRWRGQIRPGSGQVRSGGFAVMGVGVMRPLSIQKLMPFAMKLLVSLVIPHVLAKEVFPRLGYSAAVNLTVCHFAWMGSFAFCVLCYLVKASYIKLHDSIRDDRYIVGKTLEDFDCRRGPL